MTTAIGVVYGEVVSPDYSYEDPLNQIDLRKSQDKMHMTGFEFKNIGNMNNVVTLDRDLIQIVGGEILAVTWLVEGVVINENICPVPKQTTATLRVEYRTDKVDASYPDESDIPLEITIPDSVWESSNE